MLVASIVASVATCSVDALHLDGFSRVSSVVVDELLPRPLPTCLTDAEVVELERRLWSLGIFDDVAVRRDGHALRVHVREKWTLIPTIEVGNAKTLRDSYLSVNLVESNVAGRAIECGAWVAYYQRAITGEAWCGQHQSDARAITSEGSLMESGSGFVFDDVEWERRRTGGHLGLRLPFWYGTHWRFALVGQGYRERLLGEAPTGLVSHGVFVGFGGRATWDRYEWHDLVPRGARFVLIGQPGIFLAPGLDRARHTINAQLVAAHRIGPRTALLLNLVAEAVNPGDPNHSWLLGSVPSWRLYEIGGVRGLPDNRLRNAAHVYGDLELRHAFALAERWFLQGVGFVDGGGYAPMDLDGVVRSITPALSVGVGLRLVPTALAWLVPRIDAGTLIVPAREPFVLFGLSQYF